MSLQDNSLTCALWREGGRDNGLAEEPVNGPEYARSLISKSLRVEEKDLTAQQVRVAIDGVCHLSVEFEQCMRDSQQDLCGMGLEDLLALAAQGFEVVGQGVVDLLTEEEGDFEASAPGPPHLYLSTQAQRTTAATLLAVGGILTTGHWCSPVPLVGRPQPFTS